MRSFKKIAFWENKKRTKTLNYFLTLIRQYNKNITFSDYNYEPSENEKAKQYRSEINNILERCDEIILSTNRHSILTVFDAPIAGNRQYSVSVIYDFFNLWRFRVDEKTAYDIIERVIGILKGDYAKSLVRTFNPLFWIGLILEYLVNLPFNLLIKNGLLDSEKSKSSLLIKLIKFLLKIIFTVGPAIIAYFTFFEKYLRKHLK